MENLLVRYMKELKRVESTSPSGAGSDAIYQPKWNLYEELSFLREDGIYKKNKQN